MPERTVQVLSPRWVPLLGDATVARLLPRRERRSVGPFLFLDHFGGGRGEGKEPASDALAAAAPADLDVPPHPHIGLATVTYLFAGTVVHRDSLGSCQTILPGDVNWMHAGRGIAHSERRPEPPPVRVERAHGVQAWVGLPLAAEASAPHFGHHPRTTLPVREGPGTRLVLLAGRAWGLHAPAQVASPLFYAALDLAAGASFAGPVAPGDEGAAYVVRGTVTVGQATIVAPAMAVFPAGTDIALHAATAAHVLLLGGTPLDGGPRRMWWNFVASSMAPIEAARIAWRNRTFPMVPGDPGYVPLPEA